MKLYREPFNGQPKSQRFNARFLLPHPFTLPVLSRPRSSQTWNCVSVSCVCVCVCLSVLVFYKYCLFYQFFFRQCVVTCPVCSGLFLFVRLFVAFFSFFWLCLCVCFFSYKLSFLKNIYTLTVLSTNLKLHPYCFLTACFCFRYYVYITTILGKSQITCLFSFLFIFLFRIVCLHDTFHSQFYKLQ